MASVSSTYSALSSGANAGATGSAASTNSKEIAGNFQDFLTLLTTQLKNQSPLDPLDTNQFTQQLVQFAGVEQQLKSNDTLGSILTAMQGSSSANAASYIGMTITSDASVTSLKGGSANWTIAPAKDTKKATITITNSSGAVVATKIAVLKAGAQTFSWDGKDGSTLLPDGDYTISVNAIDAAGQSVAVSTELKGVVTGVDISSGAPVLNVGSSTIPLSRVKTIAYQ